MAPDNNSGSNWDQWSNYVIKAIEKLEEKIDSIEENLHKTELEIQKELVQLKTKASFAGAVFGLISSIVVSIVSGLILFALTTGMKKNTPTPQSTRPAVQQHYPTKPLVTPQSGQPTNTVQQPKQ